MDKQSAIAFKNSEKEILKEASFRYGVTPDKLKRLGSFESFVYEFERDAQSHIMKLTHSIHRTPQQVRGELEWVNYLADNGVNASRAVSSLDGNFIEVIDSRSVRGLESDYFIAYAFEKAQGRLIQKCDWNKGLFRRWGRTLGRMHALTKMYAPSDPAIKRFEWHEDESLRVKKYIPASQEIVIEKCNNRLGRLKRLPTNNDCYGLIHSDLHHGNFFVNNGEMTLFDFDDCHYSWFAFDIMIPLFYILHDAEADPNDREFARYFMDCFMCGYALENRIDKAWMARIPEFMKLREMDLYVIIHAEEAANLNGWCRRFMEKRRYKIEYDIPVIDIDFSRWGN